MSNSDITAIINPAMATIFVLYGINIIISPNKKTSNFVNSARPQVLLARLNSASRNRFRLNSDVVVIGMINLFCQKRKE
jgi:hypothetical protein